MDQVVFDSEKSVKGAHSITLEIRRVIESGRYANGEQLPPERDLADAYSSSRSTVRKALDNLEAMGLVSRKMGSGTFVTFSEEKSDAIDNVVDVISPIHLIEARIGFERQMARLAAIHATRKDLTAMQEVLEKLEDCVHDKEAFTRHDSTFHLLIAQATKNPLVVHLYEQINDVRNHSQWTTMKDIILTPEQINRYNELHREIYDALCTRDSARAIQALNDHMELARQDLLGAESHL